MLLRIFAVSATLLLVASSVHSESRNVVKTAYKGSRTVIWGQMCDATICFLNVCFDIRAKDDDQPAFAKIAIEATWRRTVNTSATGHYCAYSPWLTYFMGVAVYIDHPDEDVYVVYNEFVPG